MSTRRHASRRARRTAGDSRARTLVSRAGPAGLKLPYVQALSLRPEAPSADRMNERWVFGRDRWPPRRTRVRTEWALWRAERTDGIRPWASSPISSSTRTRFSVSRIRIPSIARFSRMLPCTATRSEASGRFHATLTSSGARATGRRSPVEAGSICQAAWGSPAQADSSTWIHLGMTSFAGSSAATSPRRRSVRSRTRCAIKCASSALRSARAVEVTSGGSSPGRCPYGWYARCSAFPRRTMATSSAGLTPWCAGPRILAVPASAHRAAEAMRGYIDDVAAQRARHPSDDLLSALVAAELRGELTVQERTGICVLLFLAGISTAASLISTSLYLLEAHPVQRRAPLREPAIIPTAVEELLEYVSPVQALARTTTRPVSAARVSCRRVPGCCSSSPRPTATRAASRTPTNCT